MQVCSHKQTHVNELAISPIAEGLYHAENATIAGIWRRQT